MRKASLFLGVIALIAFIAVPAVAAERATHTSLAEYATATWCGYCKYAHGALKNIYAGGNQDFYYVSLVTDKNNKASQRVSQFNVYGYPTVYFDGGYRVSVGAGSIPQAEAAYNSALSACGNRIVPDIDVTVDATWPDLGNDQMQVEIRVTNNETVAYAGHVRVFITEIASSLGWKDTAGNPYTFPLLDYAINTPITIPASGNYFNTMTWDAGTAGFPTVTPDNLKVIAGVYNSEWHQGYSYPPSQNPFDAYYVDEAAATDVAVAPGDPVPDVKANGSDSTIYVFTGQPVRLSISLDPGLEAGNAHDWWIAAVKNTSTYYWWVYPGTWKFGSPKRAYNGPLFAINDYEIFNQAIPAGNWNFAFAVDALDNTYQGTYIDMVGVVVY